MVLRPTLLRYKGTAKKVDSQKLKQIKTQALEGTKEIERMGLFKKSNVALILVSGLVFSGKFLFAPEAISHVANDHGY